MILYAFACHNSAKYCDIKKPQLLRVLLLMKKQQLFIKAKIQVCNLLFVTFF